MSQQIAVIGAGIAGLTAAYYLQKNGYQVTVYEANAYVGGRMTTDRIQDCTIDRGAQFLSEHYATLLPLIQEMDLVSELIEISPWGSVVRQQKIRKISPNHFFSPILSGYLKIFESYRFLSILTRWQSRIIHLPLDDYSAWCQFDDASAAEFMSKEFGAFFLEYIIEPLVQGYYFQTPEQVSKIQALMLLQFIFRKGKLLTFKKGIDTLAQKLAGFLNIKLNCPIQSINVDNDKTLCLKSNGQEFLADILVLATTASTAKELYKQANQVEQCLLNTSYSSTLNLCLASHREWKRPRHLKKLYGTLIPRKERQTIAAITFESSKDKHRVEQGELLHVMLDGQTGANLLHKPESEILNIVLPELEKYLPGISASLRFSHLLRWKEAEPIQAVGKSILINEYYKSLNSQSRIFLAGDYLGFPYTDGAAFTGRKAADMIQQLLR